MQFRSWVAYARLIATYVELKQQFEELVSRGEIDELTRRSIVDMTIKAAKNLARKYGRVVEGVKKVKGGQVLEYEAKTIRNEALAEGEARGEVKGEANGAVLALSKAVSFVFLTVEDAARVADMTVEEFERKAAEFARELPQDLSWALASPPRAESPRAPTPLALLSAATPARESPGSAACSPAPRRTLRARSCRRRDRFSSSRPRQSALSPPRSPRGRPPNPAREPGTRWTKARRSSRTSRMPPPG